MYIVQSSNVDIKRYSKKQIRVAAMAPPPRPFLFTQVNKKLLEIYVLPYHMT